jgi:tRNA(Arg) A34 adenosine deaminase TadA
VTFEAGNYSFWEESHSHLPGEHAEVKALRYISTKEQEYDTAAR